MNEQFQNNITLPHDIVKLSSGGIFYKNNKKSVKVGYLSASDENLMLAVGSIKDSFVLRLIREKLYEIDIKPEELLQGDIQSILLFLRNTSFGPEYTTTVIDPMTNKPFEVTVLLDEVNFIKPKVKINEDLTFSTILPKSNKSIKLRPLTYGEIEEINIAADRYPDGMIAPVNTWKLNKMVVELDGNNDLSYVSETISKLPIADAKYIRKFMLENEPGLDLTKEVTAPSGVKVQVKPNFGVDFFRPFF
jgi:hypothetical protein